MAALDQKHGKEKKREVKSKVSKAQVAANLLAGDANSVMMLARELHSEAYAGASLESVRGVSAEGQVQSEATVDKIEEMAAAARGLISAEVAKLDLVYNFHLHHYRLVEELGDSTFTINGDKDTFQRIMAVVSSNASILEKHGWTVGGFEKDIQGVYQEVADKLETFSAMEKALRERTFLDTDIGEEIQAVLKRHGWSQEQCDGNLSTLISSVKSKVITTVRESKESGGSGAEARKKELLGKAKELEDVQEKLEKIFAVRKVQKDLIKNGWPINECQNNYENVLARVQDQLKEVEKLAPLVDELGPIIRDFRDQACVAGSIVLALNASVSREHVNQLEKWVDNCQALIDGIDGTSSSEMHQLKENLKKGLQAFRDQYFTKVMLAFGPLVIREGEKGKRPPAPRGVHIPDFPVYFENFRKNWVHSVQRCSGCPAPLRSKLLEISNPTSHEQTSEQQLSQYLIVFQAVIVAVKTEGIIPSNSAARHRLAGDLEIMIRDFRRGHPGVDDFRQQLAIFRKKWQKKTDEVASRYRSGWALAANIALFIIPPFGSLIYYLVKHRYWVYENPIVAKMQAVLDVPPPEVGQLPSASGNSEIGEGKSLGSGMSSRRDSPSDLESKASSAPSSLPGSPVAGTPPREHSPGPEHAALAPRAGLPLSSASSPSPVEVSPRPSLVSPDRAASAPRPVPPSAASSPAVSLGAASLAPPRALFPPQAPPAPSAIGMRQFGAFRPPVRIEERHRELAAREFMTNALERCLTGVQNVDIDELRDDLLADWQRWKEADPKNICDGDFLALCGHYLLHTKPDIHLENLGALYPNFQPTLGLKFLNAAVQEHIEIPTQVIASIPTLVEAAGLLKQIYRGDSIPRHGQEPWVPLTNEATLEKSAQAAEIEKYRGYVPPEGMRLAS